MKKAPTKGSAQAASSKAIADLRRRLAEAEETLRAIGSGEVDAVVVAGKNGNRVFTLDGAEHAYRVLIESMSEGALTVTADARILYANSCFARMVRCPLEQVPGSSLQSFLSAEYRAELTSLLKRVHNGGAKARVLLNARDGLQVPVQISVRPIPKLESDRFTIGIVVTDMTEARHTEELLRALTQRVMQAQETERGRVAIELHNNITQLLCAAQFRSQALAGKLQEGSGREKREAIKISMALGKIGAEVERISRNLRPSILDQMGLTALLRSTSKEFADRTGVSIELDCGRLTARLPSDVELALYRILQEALRNIEKHTHAFHVTVRLRRVGDFVELEINDDGLGFDPDNLGSGRSGVEGLGLLSMHERASYVGGSVRIRSFHRNGTSVNVRVPRTLAATGVSRSVR